MTKTELAGIINDFEKLENWLFESSKVLTKDEEYRFIYLMALSKQKNVYQDFVLSIAEMVLDGNSLHKSLFDSAMNLNLLLTVIKNGETKYAYNN